MASVINYREGSATKHICMQIATSQVGELINIRATDSFTGEEMTHVQKRSIISKVCSDNGYKVVTRDMSGELYAKRVK